MNKLLSKAMATAMLFACATSSAEAAQSFNPSFKGQETVPLSRMRKVSGSNLWSGTGINGSKKRVAPHYTTPASHEFQYLYGPDGSQWYATCNYDYKDIELEGGYATEHLIKGFTYTIYDSKFNEIGKVSDIIKLEEGENRCAAVMLDVTVTQKFFKSDDKYEVMVAMSMNTPEYVTHTRTYVYAIEELGDDEYSPIINVIPGYPIDAIDVAKDKWTEDYYITFLTEKTADPDKEYPEYIDFLAEYKQVLTTYTKGGYNSDPKVLFEKEIRQLDLPGDQMSSPSFLCKKANGKLTLIYAHYEKSFFVDPSGMGGNEEIVPDNNLIIEVYQMNDSYPSALELINTTKIAATPNTEDPNVYYTFYGIGTLSWDNDIDFDGHYSTDGRPTFVVTVDEYLLNDDDHYNSSYYVYDADGNRIKTIAEDTFDYVRMSDLPGQEPQVMFVYTGDEMAFKFVDLYSCKVVTEIDQMYRGYGLSTSIDRVATGDGYAYASALSAGIPIDDENLYAPVMWIDTDGEMIRLDKIPTGKNVELAQIYISSQALTPYVFNTDKNIEYMLLVKRKINNSVALQEELLIANVENGVIYSFLPDKEKGNIRMVYLMEGADPELIIAYYDDDKFTTDAYALPFTKFAGGTGTENDPYLIATAGDLQQIKSAPSAYYKLISDLDFSGVSFNQIDTFKGTLDGNGHVVSNINMYSSEKCGLFRYCEEATIKNLNFYDCDLNLSGGSESALLAATSSRSTFENIHVRRLKATGNDFHDVFGGIIGKMWTYSNVTGCEVTGADIDLPSATCAGGIVGEIRTGSNITSCAFTGNMTIDNTLGGIVGSTTNGDEIISFCHVDANLKAQHTIGGIVGFLDRSKVKSNYVEGTIEAMSCSKWTNAISAGAIAGELEGDWDGKAGVAIINNLIGVKSITYPELTVAEKYPHQLATVHRIVGRTSYNSEPEAEYDKEGNFVKYKDKVIYEEGVINNLVVSDLAVIDNDFAEKTIEGTTTDKNKVDVNMLKKTLEFKYGTSSDAPWNAKALHAYDPNLYYESMIYIPTTEITANKGENFYIDIAIISQETLTEEELLDAIKCEFDEQLLEMTDNHIFDGKTLRLEMKALQEGKCNFNVETPMGKTGCTVNVVNDNNVVESIVSNSAKLIYSEGIVMADGCMIAVYDMNGKLLLSGKDKVSTNNLQTGVYVATATDNNGNQGSIKFVK